MLWLTVEAMRSMPLCPSNIVLLFQRDVVGKIYASAPRILALLSLRRCVRLRSLTQILFMVCCQSSRLRNGQTRRCFLTSVFAILSSIYQSADLATRTIPLTLWVMPMRCCLKSLLTIAKHRQVSFIRRVRLLSCLFASLHLSLVRLSMIQLAVREVCLSRLSAI